MSKAARYGKILLFLAVATLVVGLGVNALATSTTHTNIQDHQWDAGKFYSAATCAEPARYIYHCTLGCGAVKYEYRGATNPDAHVWGSWVVDRAPTCTATGSQHRVCQLVSHHTQTAEIPATGHNYDNGTIVKQPTCTESGIKRFTCYTCGNSYDEPVAPLGHDWGEWIVTKAPTCTEPGTQVQYCRRDASHQNTATINPLGHLWGDWTTITPATCLTGGTQQRVCGRDASHVERRSIDPLGHDWGEWVIVTPPTCTSNGLKTKTCRRDPSHVQQETINATGHDWDNGKIIKQPTLTETGLKRYTCRNDPSHTRDEILPILTMSNNTVCAFGPRLRDTNLYPYNSDKWYMFTPFDASQDGVQTYELVASNMYIVGTLTMTIRNGFITVDYSLYDTGNFKITLEFFTIVNNMQNISMTGTYEPEELMYMKMNTRTPIDMEANFGSDRNLVLYFCSRCDYQYSAKYQALAYNSTAHQRLLSSMKYLMDIDQY